MSINRIRQYREKKALSQRQLAEAVGTSQQQIQRIEAGVQAVRLDIAAHIAAVLGEPIDAVFPAARKALKRSRTANVPLWEMRHDRQLAGLMEGAGIDLEPEVWTLKLWLRGHGSFDFLISGIEQKRLRSLLRETESSDFIVFDARTERVAVNRNHTQAWQFLWEPPNRIDSIDEERVYMNVLLTHQSEPLHLETKPDTAVLGPESAENAGDRSSELQEIFVDLETAWGESDTLITFEDVDGEEIFIRASEIVLLSVPLSDVEPAIDVSPDDEMDEINKTDKLHKRPAHK